MSEESDLARWLYGGGGLALIAGFVKWVWNRSTKLQRALDKIDTVHREVIDLGERFDERFAETGKTITNLQTITNHAIGDLDKRVSILEDRDERG